MRPIHEEECIYRKTQRRQRPVNFEIDITIYILILVYIITDNMVHKVSFLESMVRSDSLTMDFSAICPNHSDFFLLSI